MKKLIALCLMVVCLAGFSFGCGDKAKDKPTPTPSTGGTGDAGADKTDGAADKKTDETKP